MLKTDEKVTLDLLASCHDEVWREVVNSPLAKKILTDFNKKYMSEGSDLFQDTILELFIAVCRYDEKDCEKFAVYGLMKTIARRVEADYLAKKHRRKRIATFIPWHIPGKDGSENDADRLRLREQGLEVDWEEDLLRQDEGKWVRKLLQTALHLQILNDNQWKVLWMYYWEEKNDREIALELGENINTVKSRRQRAEAKLRKELSTIAI